MIGQIAAHPAGATPLRNVHVGERRRSTTPHRSTRAPGVHFTPVRRKPVFGATMEQFAIGSTITGVHGGILHGLTGHHRGNPTTTDGGTTTTPLQFNRVSVYGLDVNGGLPFALPGLKKGAITIHGAYNVSAEGANSGFNNVGNKQRYQSHEEMAGFNLGPVAIQAGYQFIGPYYSAPGYWGKLGAWTNPTNVKGPVYLPSTRSRRSWL